MPKGRSQKKCTLAGSALKSSSSKQFGRKEKIDKNTSTNRVNCKNGVRNSFDEQLLILKERQLGQTRCVRKGNNTDRSGNLAFGFAEPILKNLHSSQPESSYSIDAILEEKDRGIAVKPDGKSNEPSILKNYYSVLNEDNESSRLIHFAPSVLKIFPNTTGKLRSLDSSVSAVQPSLKSDYPAATNSIVGCDDDYDL